METADDHLKHADDAALIKAFLDRRSEPAFTQLVRKYQKRVYWTVRRSVGAHEDADEITQEVFIQVYRKLEQFRGDSGFFTWLYQIVINQIRHHFRRQRPFSTSEETDLQLLTDAEPGPDERLQKKEWKEQLDRVIQSLPPQQRLIFILRYYDDLPYEDIARQTGRSLGACKANFFHAVQKIKGALGHENPL